MKRNSLSISFSFVTGKILACFVLFCVVFSSLNMFGAVTNSIIKNVMSVSTETSLAQFFYISSIPVDVISGLFSDRQSASSKIEKTNKSNNKNRKSEESNSTKASIGYAIIPADNTFNLKVQSRAVKAGGNGGNKNVVSGADYFGLYGRDIYNTDGNKYDGGINNVFIIMLLLAILIARRNIGDNNIINKKIEYKNQPDFEI